MNNKKKYIVAAVIALFVILAVVIGLNYSKEEPVKELTYAVFPYVTDNDYYMDLIEEKWKETEPGIRLVRAEYNCYHDTDPGDIDVFIYDVYMQNDLIQNGWIQPIDREMIQDAEDFYPFSLEGATVDGKIYGIPIFLCGNFLIYDKNCEALARAEHITDLSDQEELLLIATEHKNTSIQYHDEATADILGVGNPAGLECPEADQIMSLIDRLAIDSYQGTEPEDLPAIYDQGIGMGFMGFSEYLPMLDKRLDDTDIKQISFGEGDNIKRFYVDMAAVNGKVDGKRYEKCVELVNIMADAELLADYSSYQNKPKYLLMARKEIYDLLKERYPLYKRLQTLIDGSDNFVIMD